MGNLKAKTHIEKLGFVDKDKKSSEHDKIQLWTYDNVETVIAETIMKNETNPYKIVNRKWEFPVRYTNGSFQSLIGFIDLRIGVNGKFKVQGQLVDDSDYPVFIEVKTQIPNLGELLRQMNTYRNYISGKFIVVAPDDRYKRILNEQGIHFYKYQDPEKLF